MLAAMGAILRNDGLGSAGPIFPARPAFSFYEIALEEEDMAALRRFMAEYGQPLTQTAAVTVLIREALSSMGHLPPVQPTGTASVVAIAS